MEDYPRIIHVLNTVRRGMITASEAIKFAMGYFRALEDMELIAKEESQNMINDFSEKAITVYDLHLNVNK
jgi:hypothetical protein